MYPLLILAILGWFRPVRPTPTVTERPGFARFFEDEKLAGSFLLYDLQKDAYTAYRYDRCQQGFLPASTYKIINTLIGLETGILTDENTVMKWDGVNRGNNNWNRDNTLQTAFQVSCVPCYQELARKVGLQRMKSYVKKANYGHMDIRPDNLDTFWLMGNSRISQREEIEFLHRVHLGKDTPFSERSRAILKKVMLIDDRPTHKLYGKTGWASAPDTVLVKTPDIGWFVGYVEKGNDVYFFATNVEHPAPVPANFIASRRRITDRILAELGIF